MLSANHLIFLCDNARKMGELALSLFQSLCDAGTSSLAGTHIHSSESTAGFKQKHPYCVRPLTVQEVDVHVHGGLYIGVLLYIVSVVDKNTPLHNLKTICYTYHNCI